MEIKQYNSFYSKKLIAFVVSAFSENNILLNLYGKHSDFQNPLMVYSEFWIAVYKNKIVGSVGIRCLDSKNRIAELKRLYLLKEYQGKGYGGKLIDTAVKFAKDNNYHYIRLDTKEKFSNAIALVEKKGFYRIPRYNNGTATLFYELTL